MTKGISSLYQLHNVIVNATVAYGAPPAFGQKNTFQLWSQTISKPSDIIGQPAQSITIYQGRYCFDDTQYAIPNLDIDVNSNTYIAGIQTRRIDVNTLQHTPEFIDFIQKNTDLKVLKQAIRTHEKLVEHRFPKHYLMMRDDRKRAEMAELRIFRMALAAYLSRKDIDDLLSPDEKKSHEELLEKSDTLLKHLRNDASAPVLKEIKMKPESPTFSQFTLKRLDAWSGYNYLEGLSEVSGKEKTRRILLFIRKQLSNIRGDELNWAYKNNTAWMDAAQKIINAKGENDSAYNLLDVESKLLQTRDARRHLKHHPGVGIFIIDAILAGMKMHDKRAEGTYNGETPSLYECWNQLPASMQTDLKIGLLGQMMGNVRFWTKFGLDQRGLTMEDIPVGNTHLMNIMNLVCVFGMLVQFGFLLQSYAVLAEKYKDAEEHITQLKRDRAAAAVTPGQESEVIRLDQALKQAEKDLRSLNNKLTAQRAEIFLQLTEIGLILICMSFGPAAAWIPVAIAVIDAVMKMVDLVVEHSINLSEKYEDRNELKNEYDDLRKELDAKPGDDKERQFLIRNMFHKRNEIRDVENEITQAWFIFGRSVVVELMMDAVRFVAMGMLPLGPGFGVIAFSQVNKLILELVTDFITLPESVEEKMPYTLMALTDTCFKTTAQGQITDEINPAQLAEENVLYVKQKPDGTIQYAIRVNNQVHKEGTFNPADLDIELDGAMSETELMAAIEDRLPDILALTDARGDTNALEQLEKRDKNEGLPAPKKLKKIPHEEPAEIIVSETGPE